MQFCTLGQVKQEMNLKEMTILEVTLSLVVGCLTIALCYLIGVLVICVKKIRTLEDLTSTVVSATTTCVSKIHETESNNNTLTGKINVNFHFCSFKTTNCPV